MTSRPAATSRARRTALRLSAAAAALATVAACTTPEPAGVPVTGPANAATSAPEPALAAYYDQKLDWKPCAEFQCADLTVPIDYAKPSGGDIEIKVLKVPARNQGKRLGSLVVNPGGPGASGVDYATAADQIVGPSVRSTFDVVGFDPRGVGQSAPIDCLDDKDLDEFLGTDPTPDNPAEQRGLLEAATGMAEGCERNNPELVAHVGTADAARDMDVLRAALGDDHLNYLGKSYGTFLGSTYADLFPGRVGRFVLDGVVPPDLTSAQLAEGQARGFELATRAYVEDCVSEGDCPLGGSVDAGMEWIRGFLADLDQNPLPTGDPAVPELTEAWGSLGLAVAMYDQGAWGILTDAIREAESGSGASLMALANSYADRAPGGGYSGNMMEAIFAVNCLDRPDSPDLATYEGYEKDFAEVAPTWGPFLAWGSLACGVWPVKGDNPPHRITAEGSNPIVVVGTTRDPATIYEWSKQLRDQLANAVLVSLDGDGHTAYTRGSQCIDDALDAYFVKGTVPQDGLTC
ncbi:alpha/beta hydrolase [Intrasporangium calvum]|uniref:Alpha/beta hydrolase n=1 Tax=Intrasporangium calvum TaxID=53358 RepID=A0ABT5GDF9_9MICO|nr:alpha/beta hydrolase [Intrasporangium calvum]MDC5696278.1 alpha/beta hydrolase [Intrasporangium calvum]